MCGFDVQEINQSFIFQILETMLLRKLIEDLRRKDLLSLKALQFLQTGCLVSIFPFLPLHMKELGLTLSDISYVQTIICIGDILTPLVLGLCTNYLTSIRPLLITSIIINSLASVLLSLVDNGEHLFITYLTCRTLLEVSRGCTLNLYESVNLMTVKARHADYGIQKIFGSLGGTIIGPVAGYVAHYYSFKAVFQFYACLQILFVIILSCSDLQFQRKERKDQKKSKMLDCIYDGQGIIMFLVTAFILGLIWSFSETYAFLHLESIGYTRKNLGLTVGSSTMLGIVISLLSTSLLDVTGWRAGLALALSTYSIRLLGYSLIQQDSFTILMALECLKSFGNPWCMLVTGYFMKNHVDMSHIASFQSLFSLMYFGIGKGLGSLVGASIIDLFSSQLAFQMVSGISIVWASLLMMTKSQTNQEPKKE